MSDTSDLSDLSDLSDQSDQSDLSDQSDSQSCALLHRFLGGRLFDALSSTDLYG